MIAAVFAIAAAGHELVNGLFYSFDTGGNCVHGDPCLSHLAPGIALA
jgi:hypothetical protein